MLPPLWCTGLCRTRFLLRVIRSFVRQKPALALDAAAVAGERTIGPDYAMTRNDYSNRIGPVGKTNGAHCCWPADLLSKFGIGYCRATSNCAQGAPHTALEGRACRLHRQSVDRIELSRKVSVDRVRQGIRIASGFEPESALAILKPKESTHPIFVIRPITGTEILIVVGDNQHLAGGSVDSVNEQLQDLSHANLDPPLHLPGQPRGAVRHRPATDAMTRRG